MTLNNKQIRANIEHILFKVVPVYLFFYITFTKYFPRGSYNITESKVLNTIPEAINKQFENLPKYKARKKILQDIKLHTNCNNWSRKSVTKIILNKEGKIVGYKFHTIFYPNYFTKSQTDKINTKNKFSKYTSCLQSIIIKYN